MSDKYPPFSINFYSLERKNRSTGDWFQTTSGSILVGCVIVTVVLDSIITGTFYPNSRYYEHPLHSCGFPVLRSSENQSEVEIYQEDALFSTLKTHSMGYFEMIRSERAVAPKCECGSAHTSNPSHHYDWCVMYKRRLNELT